MKTKKTTRKYGCLKSKTKQPIENYSYKIQTKSTFSRCKSAKLRGAKKP